MQWALIDRVANLRVDQLSEESQRRVHLAQSVTSVVRLGSPQPPTRRERPFRDRDR